MSARRASWLSGSNHEGRTRPATRGERGQALVVIAMAMIGLLAFIGLTVDAGILFIGQGHLRRAVDAAALAAAGQFRVGRTSDQLQQAAMEVVHLNGVDPSMLTLGICSPGDPSAVPPIPADSHNDDSLCPQGNAPHRKLVKVTARVMVRFAFLGIIGIPSTEIVTDSVSETASVDVALVIDTSNSMTFDAASGDPLRNPATCNAATPSDPNDAAAGFTGNCHPFLEVKKAAVDFIHHLYWPYDRLSIVTFDIVPTLVMPINNTQTVGAWEDTVKHLNVSPPQDPGVGLYCTFNTDQNPLGCVNTSIGGGLKVAGGQFGVQPIRQEAVWVVILLTDGAANASEPNGAIINRFCPPSTWWDLANDPNLFNPFCRDADKTTRHSLIDWHIYQNATYDPSHPNGTYNPQNSYDVAHYDTDDYARDNADFVACAPKYATAAKWCRDSLDYTTQRGGQGALIYSIGLGRLVIDNPKGGGIPDGSAHNGEARIAPSNYISNTNLAAGYDAGDYLLRYIANVGLDGNPDPNVGPDPCQAVPPPTLIAQPVPAPPDDQPPPALPSGNLSYNCGNYYFSQFGTGLNAVFQSIASRIFTRITK